MWQVLYLQMSSSVPAVSFQRWLYTQMGPAKKQEVIYFSRQVFLVHKTHGHLLRRIANGRKSRRLFMQSRCQNSARTYNSLICPHLLCWTTCKRMNSHLLLVSFVKWLPFSQHCSGCVIWIPQISTFSLKTTRKLRQIWSSRTAHRALFLIHNFYHHIPQNDNERFNGVAEQHKIPNDHLSRRQHFWLLKQAFWPANDFGWKIVNTFSAVPW